MQPPHIFRGNCCSYIFSHFSWNFCAPLIILTCVVKHRGHKSPWTSHVPNQNIPTSSRPEHPNPLFHNIYIRSDNLCIKFFELGTLCPCYQLKKELSCAKLTFISYPKRLIDFILCEPTAHWVILIVQSRKYKTLASMSTWFRYHVLNNNSTLASLLCRHGFDIMSEL